MADGAGAAFTFAYDAAGRQTARQMPNGVVSTYEYNGLDQLTRLTHARGATTIDDYQYQQNPAGQITQITDQQTGTHTYAYDTLNRLTGATHTNQPAESYAYDAVGNRTTSQRSASYTHQPFNKLTSTATATYVYDANGNLTSKTEGGATTAYMWDGENRLTRVVLPGGASVTYKYDALGRRVERATNGGAVWTRYIYDGANIVRNLRSDGQVTEHLNGNGVDELLKQKMSSTSEQYLLTDHLGSTTALTDTSGNVIERMSYDSFGNSAASGRTRYLFTGREYDGGAGLYYYRARWYDAQVGRFLSEDPIGHAGGINLYAYVRNNPTKFRDPFGLYEYEGDVDLDPVTGRPRGGHYDRPNYYPGGMRDNISSEPFILFRRDVWDEFFTAKIRARQPCKPFGERFVGNFVETNEALLGAAAPTGTGLALRAGAPFAEITGELTFGQWANNWFAPVSGTSRGAMLRSTAIRGGMSSVAVAGSYETGVAIGSFVSAAGCPCGY